MFRLLRVPQTSICLPFATAEAAFGFCGLTLLLLVGPVFLLVRHVGEFGSDAGTGRFALAHVARHVLGKAAGNHMAVTFRLL